MTPPPDRPLPPRLRSATVILPLALLLLLMPPIIGIVADWELSIFGAPWIVVYVFGLWIAGVVASNLLAGRLLSHTRRGQRGDG